MAQLVKTIGGLAIASVKTLGGLAIASVKTVAGLDNTSGGGGGTWSHIDAKGGGGNSATLSAAALTAASAGDTIMGWVCWEDPAITLTSVTDGTNTYTLLHNPTTGDGSARAAMFYCLSVSAGTFTVSANLSSAAFGNTIAHLARDSGGTPSFDKSALVEQIFPGTGTNAVSSGNVTTVSNGQYIFGASAKCSASGNVLTSGTGYTSRVQQNNSGAASLSENQIQTSAGAIAATFTTSSDGPFLTGIMTFNAG